ncbi:MAG TPA: bifunctional pyr operon transcriptional regulator/uracil phosphoribosyltransferase PyrR [Phycisphaerae bacterium]|jgi:pyrimidine operon attenuation protein/uracil phosphoribosyltransferase
MQTLLDGGRITQLLAAIADKIVADPSIILKSKSGEGSGTSDGAVALVGIRSRGELLAQRLAVELCGRLKVPQIDVGALDITMYRDDLASRRAITIPKGTDMNFRLDGRPVVLIDDVLETGRSVRAALDALVAYGRPRLIRLAVLVDRGRHEFPIAADYVGINITEVAAEQKIRVRLKPTDSEDRVSLE